MGILYYDQMLLFIYFVLKKKIILTGCLVDTKYTD